MKRVIIKRKLFSQKHPHFIGSWNIENNDLCKEIINLFEGNVKLQKQGMSGLKQDVSIKKTTDIGIKPNDLKDPKFHCVKEYIKELHKCFVDYQTQWPFLKAIIKDVDIGAFNLQKYSPGDHFSKIHSERCNLQSLHRIFAWMIYLNDVDDGGMTSFPHYGIKIKPARGKVIIWPSEWTHAHAGEILNSGEKYIMTGWMHFSNNEVIENRHD